MPPAAYLRLCDRLRPASWQHLYHCNSDDALRGLALVVAEAWTKLQLGGQKLQGVKKHSLAWRLGLPTTSPVSSTILDASEGLANHVVLA